MAAEYPTPSDPGVIPDDLIKEILKFLPVKSLMRFKCVSKNWLSIITEPSFTSAYSGGFRGPVAFWPDRTKGAHPYKEIHYLGIDDTGPIPTCEAYHHSTVDYGGQKLEHTAVVNGLICLFDGGGNRSWLYNIATRERVQLPASSSVPVPTTDDKAQMFVCNYRLGLDPISKLYKLVKLSFPIDESTASIDELLGTSLYFEILTIGVDSCWRIINSPPPPSLGYPCVSVDGVVYALEYISHADCSLSAFDVAEERYLSVPMPPDFYTPPINDDWDWRFWTLQLLPFFPGPGPVLIHDSGEDSIRIDRYSYGGGDGGGGDGGGEWHGEIVSLPHRNLVPRGILPNGKVLIADRSDPNIPPGGSSRKLHFGNYRGLKPASLSLYDPIERRLEKLVMTNWNGPNTTAALATGDYFYLEENIVSLKCPNTTAALATGDYFYLEENIVSLKCLTSCCSNN